MNQVKIGKFIAKRRKLQNLTQLELADKLLVTDRAVSKWERGISLPDSSIMLDLCKILKISVNDLLNGEIVTMENNENLERTLLEMIKQKEESDKRLLALEWVIGVLSVLILLLPIIIGAYIPMKDWQKIIIILSGLFPCLIGLYFAVKIEQVAGYYECKLCGHKYVPTFNATLFSMHMGRTRYFKCPNCGKKSWQKKVISKD